MHPFWPGHIQQAHGTEALEKATGGAGPVGGSPARQWWPTACTSNPPHQGSLPRDRLGSAGPDQGGSGFLACAL